MERDWYTKVSCFLAFLYCFVITFLRLERNGHGFNYIPFLPKGKSLYIGYIYGGIGIRECFRRTVLSRASTVISVVREKQNYDEKDEHAIVYPSVINFGSYNYLGYATENYQVKEQLSELTQISTCNMSPMGLDWQVGNKSEHIEELERKVAEFLGVEDAVVYSTGWMTNVSTLPLLIDEKTLIIADEKNHASLALGCRMGQSKHKVLTFKFNDMADLERVIQKALMGAEKKRIEYSKIIIVVEGIYSMEGNILDLRTLMLVKKRYNAYVYIDEAHSIGAIGENGRGVCEIFNVQHKLVDVLMGTFTKSFASIGGYIAGKKALIDCVRRHSSSLKYETCLSDACALQIINVLEDLKNPDKGGIKLKKLRDNTLKMRRLLCEKFGHNRLILGQDESPVIPILTFDTNSMAKISRFCLKRGIAVVVAGFPATSFTGARVRLCVSAGHTDEDIEKACDVVHKAYLS